jgi:hypothetical protein
MRGATIDPHWDLEDRAMELNVSGTVERAPELAARDAAHDYSRVASG